MTINKHFIHILQHFFREGSLISSLKILFIKFMKIFDPLLFGSGNKIDFKLKTNIPKKSLPPFKYLFQNSSSCHELLGLLSIFEE